MKTKIRKLRYIFLVILLITLGIQFIYILSTQFTFSLIQKVILILIQGLCVFGYAHFHNIDQNAMKVKKCLNNTHLFMFVLYVFNLIYVLFLDPDFGRRLASYTTMEEYLKYNVNLELFASIRLFVNGYEHHYVTLETILRNIVGNAIVFMPMAYFLPLFFKKQRKWLWFIVTIFFMVFSVELLQVVLKIGSGDIDDLFLNVSGALFIYGVLKFLPLSKLYKKMGRS